MKLLVTGASGFLGWTVCEEAKGHWTVYGIVHSHPVQMEGVEAVRADLTRFQELKTLFEQIRPDAVIHTAAVSSPNFCQEYRAESHKINVEATENLAGLCADHSIPFAFTSSDLVFDGLNPPYSEEASPCPVSVYGEQKVTAEQRVANRHPGAAICRMPLMFGHPSPAAQSFLQPMIQTMREGRELRLFTDEFRTPVSAKTASRGLFMALEKVHGLIHLGGAERISRYELGVLLADLLGFDTTSLIACRQQDIPMPASRPPDVSLDSKAAFNLGYTPKPLREELGEAVKRFTGAQKSATLAIP